MSHTDQRETLNALAPHHRIFESFTRTQPYSDQNAHYNFVGARISDDFESDLTEAAPSLDKRVAFGLKASGRSSLYDEDQTYPHRDSEDYFEWIDLLTSIARAEDTFTMLEVGAGYGRWIANAAAAIKRLKSGKDLRTRLVALEANKRRFALMVRNCEENGIPKADTELRREACTADGSPVIMKCNDDYGTGIVRNDALLNAAPFKHSESVVVQDASGGKFTIEKVPATKLPEMLTQSVDFLDMDIQGAELDVLSSSMKALTQQVKLVHIATHSIMIDARLAHLFHLHEWRPRFLFPFGQDSATQFGRFHFLDGIQSWENPRFSPGNGAQGSANAGN
jgi:FkbM family methyltransferase